MDTVSKNLGPVKNTDYLPENLCDYGKRDAEWDRHKGVADRFVKAFERYGTATQRKHAQRMAQCAMVLLFDRLDGGLLRLHHAWFCHVRGCPICEWRIARRRALMMIQFLPELMTAYTRGAFVFLTIAQRNCSVGALRQNLKDFNAAWNNFSRRKFFVDLSLGWLKRLEVTRNDEDDSVHLHAHVIVLVDRGYFTGRKYIKQSQWTDAWRECLYHVRGRQGDPTDGWVHVQRVKSGQEEKGILETLKYAVKPLRLRGLDDAVERWYVHVIKQLQGQKMVACGGAFKELIKRLREGEESTSELIHGELESDDEKPVLGVLGFSWRSLVQ